jgi:hypothetical protein
VQIVTNTDRYNGCDQYHVPKALIHPDLIDHWVQVSHALDLGLAAFDYVAGEGGLATMEGGAVVDVNKQPAVEGPFEALAWEGYARASELKEMFCRAGPNSRSPTPPCRSAKCSASLGPNKLRCIIQPCGA